MPTSTLFTVAALMMLPAMLFASYPLLLLALSRLAPFRDASPPGHGDDASDTCTRPSFALITVAGRQDARLERKLEELARLAEHGGAAEVLVGLDGGTAPPASNPPLEWIAVMPAEGKNAVLRRLHATAQADVLVFSDTDAQVEPESLDALLEPFSDATIGAVTGRRRIVDGTRFGKGQAGYSDFEECIRRLEMRCLGSVTSCEGKLYAIRRSLVGELPEEVTDDLYTGLGAVAAGKRLVSEPTAIARVGRPARDIHHDLERRRRVTCRGLATLWHRRALLDPARHGRYAVALFTNKLLRRLAAPCTLLALVATSIGAALSPTLGLLIGVVLAACAAVLVTLARLLGKGAALTYLVLGTIGMALGVLDYLRGRRVRHWEPRKQDPTPVPESGDGR